MTKEALYIESLYKDDIFAETGKDIREFGEIIKFLKSGDKGRLVLVKTRHTFFD